MEELPPEVQMSMAGPGSSASSSGDELQMDIGLLVHVLALSDPSFLSLPSSPGRCGNSRRDRQASILEVRSWDDVMFKRQFRLSRVVFNQLLGALHSTLRKDEKKATASSGSSISPELRLLITLRMLAGTWSCQLPGHDLVSGLHRPCKRPCS
jgi:hypothetical protein